VQRHESDPQSFQFLPRQVSHPFVFAEDDDLSTLFDRQFTDDLAKLGEFRRMVRLLVERKVELRASHVHRQHRTRFWSISKASLAVPFRIRAARMSFCSQ
jgi:hypothetical protein